MSDRIILRNIRLEGRHGVPDEERATPQPFEVDVELVLDLEPAGATDDLSLTIDYSEVDEIVRRIVGTQSFRLLEALAEAISREIIASYAVAEVIVRVRKPAVRLGGPLDHAAVEIQRRPTPG